MHQQFSFFFKIRSFFNKVEIFGMLYKNYILSSPKVLTEYYDKPTIH